MPRTDDGTVTIPVTYIEKREEPEPQRIPITTRKEPQMADRIEGLSEEEQSQAQALKRVLTKAVERLETAEGPADDLQTAGVVNALDEITEGKKLAGSALRKLNLLLEE